MLFQTSLGSHAPLQIETKCGYVTVECVIYAQSSCDSLSCAFRLDGSHEFLAYALTMTFRGDSKPIYATDSTQDLS